MFNQIPSNVNNFPSKLCNFTWKLSRNKGGNLFKSHFGLETSLKSQFLDFKLFVFSNSLFRTSMSIFGCPIAYNWTPRSISGGPTAYYWTSMSIFGGSNNILLDLKVHIWRLQLLIIEPQCPYLAVPPHIIGPQCPY